ncbi:uncharacterized protein BDZ99DRAFT_481577 [Mytilinidion resinicola]|uniref:Uncharacterized protein n=1 Tax=Mytilinidion resinicola TaxID=574789 RepID=A0A6A6Y656_9PEZI|nr:uncharacterized protein BDZ99DRAFT_481577 [Mytilinidion resinicola]KAF2804003.1 hypothetical protein BDZ99DRAFT_481577 [Mytilinidion resinicola]
MSAKLIDQPGWPTGTTMSGTRMVSPFMAGLMAISVSGEKITSDKQKVYSILDGNTIGSIIDGFNPGTVNKLANSGIHAYNRGDGPYAGPPIVSPDFNPQGGDDIPGVPTGPLPASTYNLEPFLVIVDLPTPTPTGTPTPTVPADFNCDCGESGCSLDSMPCCANGSCQCHCGESGCLRGGSSRVENGHSAGCSSSKTVTTICVI